MRAAALAAFSAALGGCAVDLAPPAWPPRVVERVEVSLGAAVAQPGDEVPVLASVVGPLPVSQAVTWLVVPPTLGGKTAYVDNGRLVIPGYVSRSATRVQVRATSVVDPDVFGTAELEIPALALRLAPRSATVAVGEPFTFQAQLDGMQQGTPLSWSATGGAIDGTGRFVATTPPTVNPVTVSVALPGEGLVLTAEVTVLLAPPVLTAVTGGLEAGAPLTLHGEGFMAGSWTSEPAPAARLLSIVEFQDDLGAVHQEPTACASATECTATVPPGFRAGTVRLRLAGGGYPAVTSGPLPHLVAPGLRLRADRNRLAAGETTTLRTAVLGGASALPITFTADAGTVSGDRYTAPATPPASGQVHVRACLGASGRCAGQTLAVAPLRIEPEAPLVSAGGTLALTAVGGSGPVTFALASGGGAVTPDGRFTAPTAPADGGATWLLASDGVRTIPVEVAISGLGPGLLLRRDDVVGTPPEPLAAGVPWGERALGVASDGARLYVAAEPRVAAGTWRWLDVYDLADPFTPSWVGAVALDGSVESSPAANSLEVVAGRLHVLSGQLGHDVLEAFDLGGPLPTPVARTIWPVAPPPALVWSPSAIDTIDAEAAYLLTPVDPVAGTFTVETRRLDVQPGTPPRVSVIEVPPAVRLGGQEGCHVTAGHDLAYAYCEGRVVAAWDLTVDPPALRWTMAVTGSFRSNPFGLEWPYLRTNWNTCLDGRASTPAFVPCGLVAQASIGSRGLTNHAELIDLTDPLQPTILSSPSGQVYGALGSVLLGDLGWQADGGLVLYDLAPGGLPGVSDTPISGADFSSVTGVRAGAGLLYVAGTEQATGRGLMAVLDPVTGAARWSTTWASGNGVSVVGLDVRGGLAAVALGSGGVEIFSVADPGAPVSLATVPVQVNGVLLGGPVAAAWSGTRLTAIDLTSPAAPAVVGDLDLGRGIGSVHWLAPGRLVVGLDYSSWLAVVDLSSAAPPVLVATPELGVSYRVAGIDGMTAWVIATDGLRALDLSDPIAPALLAFVPVSDGLQSPSWLEGGVLWATTGRYSVTGVRGYDVRRPAWPRLVSWLRQSVGVVEPTALGTYAVGRSGGAGIPSRLIAVDMSAARNVVAEGLPAPSPAPGVSP